MLSSNDPQGVSLPGLRDGDLRARRGKEGGSTLWISGIESNTEGQEPLPSFPQGALLAPAFPTAHPAAAVTLT